jgi:hypothetical protein
MKKQSAALALFFLTLVACRTMAPGSGTSDRNQATAVQVDNQGFLDMTVYAARSAQRLRLGLAPGHTITVLSVPPGIVGGLTPLRFIADPIGGSRPSVSEEITVTPGDTVVMTIPPI